MAERKYHVIDTSHPELKTVALVDRIQAHRLMRQEKGRPLVAISEETLKKAIAAGWW